MAEVATKPKIHYDCFTVDWRANAALNKKLETAEGIIGHAYFGRTPLQGAFPGRPPLALNLYVNGEPFTTYTACYTSLENIGNLMDDLDAHEVKDLLGKSVLVHFPKGFSPIGISRYQEKE
ncbi:MAG: hypothetical protein HY518_02720 [Candidatus Aenigmarchaeota archaeon]|nr:hypothetical protein [Candidatus Aenigmarchaeota archaeon]